MHHRREEFYLFNLFILMRHLILSASQRIQEAEWSSLILLANVDPVLRLGWYIYFMGYIKRAENE